MTEQKERLRQLLREIWSEGNIGAADKYVAPRYVIHHDPGDPWDGKALDLAGYKERVKLSRAPFPDQHFDVQELFADGGSVVVTWLFPGTSSMLRITGKSMLLISSTRQILVKSIQSMDHKRSMT